MTMHVLIKNGAVDRFPYSGTDLVFDNPNTSFPAGELSDELLEQWDVFRVAETSPPSYDEATQSLVQSPPVKVSGVWTQRWELEQASADEIDRRRDAKSSEVRAQRNALLSACDWTQLTDAPLSEAQREAWGAYRQALRDIPQQSGFPWSVTWPTQP